MARLKEKKEPGRARLKVVPPDSKYNAALAAEVPGSRAPPEGSGKFRSHVPRKQDSVDTTKAKSSFRPKQPGEGKDLACSATNPADSSRSSQRVRELC